ncbi:MAG TPA: hypothetical protein VFQ88_06915 [Nevskiaceae bacterium]|nr:hypothetical protein [Nevskiaceae bacterium]
MTDAADVTQVAALPAGALQKLLDPYHLELHWVADHAKIPGTFWGEPEAGLIGNGLYVRSDTPVHSALHEACHFICMDDERRAHLHTNAGGDDTEECGVCYLQILLADSLPGFGQSRALRDMDAWGYSFRLGSAQAWFERDAADARAFLMGRRLLPAGH